MRSGIGSVGKALSVRRECSNPVIRLISLSRSCSRLSCILFFCSFFIGGEDKQKIQFTYFSASNIQNADTTDALPPYQRVKALPCTGREVLSASVVVIPINGGCRAFRSAPGNHLGLFLTSS